MRKNASLQKNYMMSGAVRGMYGSANDSFFDNLFGGRGGREGRSHNRGLTEGLREELSSRGGRRAPGTVTASASGYSKTSRSRSRSGRPSGSGTRVRAKALAAAGRTHSRRHRNDVFVRDIVKGHRVAVHAPSRPLSIPAVRISPRGILLALLAMLTMAAAVILMFFNFETATVYGNTKYSQEQIESFITRGRLGDNTFVMALKYHNRKVEGIPFVDRIDIDIVSPSTVRVNIAEKPLDGCIYYGGQNVYFSKEGMIETVSGRVAEEATVINGVVLTHSNTGHQVLAQNQLGLDRSLEAMRVMEKYGIHADSITVDEKSSLTVTFGDVDVKIGKSGYDQKMFKLHQILPHMEGKKGEISMAAYESDYADSEIVLSPKKETMKDILEEEPIDAVV